MRLHLVLAILCGLSVAAFSQTIVPSSKSPNGKIALYYQYDPSVPLENQYKFYFRDTSSLNPLSTDLVLDQTPPELFVEIGMVVEAKRTNAIPAPFTSCMAWSPDPNGASSKAEVGAGGPGKYWSTT